MDAPPAVGKLRFGEHELDLGTGELRRGDQVIPLGDRPAKLLGLLAWKHGELATRDDIQRHLWPDGTTVEFDQSINQHIRHLRQVLGDSAAKPSWIQTLPARGYRFLVTASYEAPRAPVTIVTSGTPDDLYGAAAPDPGVELAPRRARWLPRSLVALSTLALVALITMLAGSGSATRVEPLAVRVAVLPLAADDPANGPRALLITEDVITALGESYAPGLEAIALRTALRYRTAPAPSIADELGVDYLVEGRVQSHGGRVRVSVRLVRARDSSQLWARTFDEPQAPGWAMETMIAQDVAAAVGRIVLVRVARPDAPLDAAAQDDLVRARFLLRGQHPVDAAPVFARLTARAPRSVKAWAGRALAELQSGDDAWLAASASADRALALDPEQPEAHFVRATIAFYGEWSLERARDHFLAAIRANPAYAEAHHSMAGYYSATGRHDEAIAAMRRARELDPLAPEVVSDVGWYYYFARRYDEAADWCERTLRIEPAFYWAHRCIVMARARAGDRPRAITAALADLRARDASPAAIAEIRDAADPLAAYWRWDLEHPPAGGDPGDRAVTRLQLDDLDGALTALERAARLHRGWLLPFLAVDPTFDALRGQPRFERLLERVRAGTTLQ